ncbi:MAG: RNA methyltransferase [Planctomycetota bacterium]
MNEPDAKVTARTPITIDDLEDPRIEVFRDVREKDLRGRKHLFVGESELVLRRMVRQPDRLHAILLTHQKYDRVRDDLRTVPSHVPIYVTDVERLSQIAGFHIHRGVLVTGHRPTAEQLSMDSAFAGLRDRASLTFVIAEGLTNVDNIGALFRNAAAFGVDGILLDPTCCDPLYRKAVRVSMGHTLSTPYAVAQSWPDDLDRLRDEWGVRIVAAEITGASQPVWTMPNAPRQALLFGSEGHGVSDGAIRRCDGVFHVPMHGDVPSLNVGVASAVMLYEWMRPGRSV